MMKVNDHLIAPKGALLMAKHSCGITGKEQCYCAGDSVFSKGVEFEPVECAFHNVFLGDTLLTVVTLILSTQL